MSPAELKAWRDSLDLSQRDAAKALGVTPATYQALERGTSFVTGKPIEIDLRTEFACRYLAEHPELIPQ